VGEESHLEEMRTAIRGDFERLARRRGDQELLRVTDAGEESETPDAEVFGDVDRDAEPETSQPRRSWLTRFVSP
jgi:hypothetical protein